LHVRVLFHEKQLGDFLVDIGNSLNQLFAALHGGLFEIVRDLCNTRDLPFVPLEIDCFLLDQVDLRTRGGESNPPRHRRRRWMGWSNP